MYITTAKLWKLKTEVITGYTSGEKVRIKVNEGDAMGRLSVGEEGLVLSLFALYEFLQ